MKWSIQIWLIALLLFSLAGRESPQLVPVEQIEDPVSRRQIKRRLSIQSRVADGAWKNHRAISIRAGEALRLRLAGRGHQRIRWYLIFPDLTQIYKNANHPWEPNAYAWVGFGRIQYYRIELKQFEGQSSIEPLKGGHRFFDDVRSWFKAQGKTDADLEYYHDDVGTFLFQVEAERGNRRLRSPGIEDANQRGLPESVFRVSVREVSGYLGYVSAYYNVPGVFGSVISQSMGHIGVDCADLLMAAHAHWRKKPLNKNYNVQQLVEGRKKMVTTTMSRGRPSVPVRWGVDIRPGDLIAVRYGSSGLKYHHIGALHSDRNSNGLLDGADLVLHAGPHPLQLASLDEGFFDGHVVVLRLK